MRKLSERNRVILALDVEERKRAIDIARSVERLIDGIKLSRMLVEKYGLEVIDELRREVKVPLIYDCKLADIPYINGRLARLYFGSGLDGIIVHGFIGEDAVEACVEAARESDAYVFVLVEMTHEGSERFMGGKGEAVAEMAREVGASGIIAPANRPRKIRAYREVVGEDMLILSPGIGAQGASPGDAIINGANFEIVGRLIYRSEDPVESATKLVNEIKSKVNRGERAKI